MTSFGTSSQVVGTPAVDSGWRDDLYLTIDAIPQTGSSYTFGVVVQPLVSWLWAGGAIIVAGSALAAVPGRRRRPTDPVSAPVVTVEEPAGEPEPDGDPGPGGEPVTEPEPATAGSAETR